MFDNSDWVNLVKLPYCISLLRAMYYAHTWIINKTSFLTLQIGAPIDKKKSDKTTKPEVEDKDETVEHEDESEKPVEVSSLDEEAETPDKTPEVEDVKSDVSGPSLAHMGPMNGGESMYGTQKQYGLPTRAQLLWPEEPPQMTSPVTLGKHGRDEDIVQATKYHHRIPEEHVDISVYNNIPTTVCDVTSSVHMGGGTAILNNSTELDMSSGDFQSLLATLDTDDLNIDSSIANGSSIGTESLKQLTNQTTFTTNSSHQRIPQGGPPSPFEHVASPPGGQSPHYQCDHPGPRPPTMAVQPNYSSNMGIYTGQPSHNNLHMHQPYMAGGGNMGSYPYPVLTQQQLQQRQQQLQQQQQLFQQHQLRQLQQQQRCTLSNQTQTSTVTSSVTSPGHLNMSPRHAMSPNSQVLTPINPAMSPRQLDTSPRPPTLSPVQQIAEPYPFHARSPLGSVGSMSQNVGSPGSIHSMPSPCQAPINSPERPVSAHGPEILSGLDVNSTDTVFTDDMYELGGLSPEDIDRTIEILESERCGQSPGDVSATPVHVGGDCESVPSPSYNAGYAQSPASSTNEKDGFGVAPPIPIFSTGDKILPPAKVSTSLPAVVIPQTTTSVSMAQCLGPAVPSVMTSQAKPLTTPVTYISVPPISQPMLVGNSLPNAAPVVTTILILPPTLPPTTKKGPVKILPKLEPSDSKIKTEQLVGTNGRRKNKAKRQTTAGSVPNTVTMIVHCLYIIWCICAW